MPKNYEVYVCEDCKKNSTPEDTIRWMNYHGNVYCYHAYTEAKNAKKLSLPPLGKVNVKSTESRQSESETNVYV